MGESIKERSAARKGRLRPDRPSATLPRLPLLARRGDATGRIVGVVSAFGLFAYDLGPFGLFA
jgi:hypothetical protein